MNASSVLLQPSPLLRIIHELISQEDPEGGAKRGRTRRFHVVCDPYCSSMSFLFSLYLARLLTGISFCRTVSQPVSDDESDYQRTVLTVFPNGLYDSLFALMSRCVLIPSRLTSSKLLSTCVKAFPNSVPGAFYNDGTQASAPAF